MKQATKKAFTLIGGIIALATMAALLGALAAIAAATFNAMMP